MRFCIAFANFRVTNSGPITGKTNYDRDTIITTIHGHYKEKKGLVLLHHSCLTGFLGTHMLVP